jgi:hypothetical protein
MVMRIRKRHKEPETGLPYRCNHCGKTVLRDSTKAWVRSFCETTGRHVHLVRVKQ